MDRWLMRCSSGCEPSVWRWNRSPALLMVRSNGHPRPWMPYPSRRSVWTHHRQHWTTLSSQPNVWFHTGRPQLQRTLATTVRIGAVEREVIDVPPDNRHRIPRGYLDTILELSHNGVDYSTSSSPQQIIQRRHLQWLLQKDALGQDCLLVGPPGAGAVHRRRLLYAYAELARRPVQVLTLSRDTTAQDLTQRRTLRAAEHDDRTMSTTTDVVFDPQAPVRAAIHGHILILDGLHTVERNVLPTLNNLLENRELPLEDGRLLVSSARYAQLRDQCLLNHHLSHRTSVGSTGTQQYVPVHPDFRVMGSLSVNAVDGGWHTTLDPPVRSRFQLRRIDSRVPTTFMTSHEDSLAMEHSTVKAAAMQSVTRFASTLQATEATADVPTMPFPVETAVPAMTRAMTLFPKASLRDLVARHCPSASSDARLEAALRPWTMAVSTSNTVKRVHDELRTRQSNATAYTLDRVVEADTATDKTMTAWFHPDTAVTVPSGGHTVSSITQFVNNDNSISLLTSMVQEHAIGRDILLLAPKGEGKSVLAQKFAETLSYQIHLFPLYKEMTARDLLQRTTATGWMPSPLLQAAMTGQVCILDGVEKLSRDTLASLQGLLTDREVHLSDGTKFVSQDRLDHDSANGGANVVLPSFRVVALGSISGSRGRSSPTWLTEDVGSMFSTIPLVSPDRETFLNILRPENVYSETELNQLLDFHDCLLKDAEDCGVSPLSIRTMKRIVKRCVFSDDTGSSIYDSICSSLLADLLSPTQRSSLNSLLSSNGIRSRTRKAKERKQHELAKGSISVTIETNRLQIGGFEMSRSQPSSPELVPSPYFFDIAGHVQMIRTLLSEWATGERAFLLLGNQGTGKNKICDRLCELGNFEREYMQLHRDSTIGQLTMSPSLEEGKIVWKDSPLVRAVTHGRALVIDEADKAPLEVVAVLKSLIEDGELLLADGRRVLRSPSEDDTECIPIHPNFTVWVLANRPGRLFHGNDFYSEIGDCFSSHVVPNPDLKSEIRLLQEYAPSVEAGLLRRIATSFDELRKLFEKGDITYPYSTREAVGVAKHLEKYPDDDVVTVLHNVLDLDSFDPHLYRTLADVFSSNGFAFESNEYLHGMGHATTEDGLEIEYKSDRTSEGTSTPPPLSSPKLGKWDDKNEAHVGGNQWQGGTGGSDTAGLGGRGGPVHQYRLDRGHKVHQVSDEAKAQVSEESKAAARRIAQKALQEKLDSIGMTEEANSMYQDMLSRIKGDVANLRSTLAQVELKTSERIWMRRQLDGELDDSRLVDGLAGDKHVYKRRGIAEPSDKGNASQKRLRFVVDCSGSMYRFNGYDSRLQRCLEATALVMESFDGMDDRFDYSIVGHSGDSDRIQLVDFGKPPANEKERLAVLQTMVYHSQYCQSGDNTLGAIREALVDISSHGDNDDESSSSIVIAISDANLERYGIHPRQLGRVMQAPSLNTKAFCIFIASFGQEADLIKKELPTGRGFVCMDSSELPAVVREILTTEIGY